MRATKIIRDLETISEDKLGDFFEAWPNPPTAQKLFKILQNASRRAIAIEESTGKVIGFTYAISDEILSAYIPLLEVKPQWRKQGIGKRLVEDLLEQLRDFYMIDVCCDADVVPFYEKLNFQKVGAGLVRRNYAAQSGRE